MVSTCASVQAQAWINFGSGKSAKPVAALGSAQEAFDVSIECCRLFQSDRVAGVGTDPETGVGKSGFQHQVGLKAADILVTHGEQYRHCHSRQLIAQIMQ